MEKLCNFLYSFSKISWTKTTLIICLIPCVLALLIVFIFFLICTEVPGAVVSNTQVCAAVGKDVLEEGGSVVDAAIATMLCEGVALPNSAGIGGGFVAVLFINGEPNSIVATPTVPQAFANVKKVNRSYTEGAKSVGVPGELMGYWELHQRYGLLTWERLFQPSIELCEQGVPMTEWLANILRHYSSLIGKRPSMIEAFPFWQKQFYSQGYKLKFPALAKTFKRIAKEGVSVFYNGDIGRRFIEDLENDGGIISFSDLQNYKVLWNNILPTLRLGKKFKVITSPLPTSGALVALILNIIKGFHIDENSTVYWHTLIEAMKYAFGFGQSLGDTPKDSVQSKSVIETYLNMISVDFARIVRHRIKANETFSDPEHYGTKYPIRSGKGTSNVCVFAPNGDAVVATTSLLYQFGAFFRSNQTGIIPNNLIKRFLASDDNELRPIHTYWMFPGARVLMPHCPTIVLSQEDAKVFFMISASGGLKAVTLTANSIIRYVLMHKSAADAASQGYLHHQLIPNWIEYEEFQNEKILVFLQDIGYNLLQKATQYENFTAVSSIGRRTTNVDMYFDKRVGGSKKLVIPKHELNSFFVFVMSTLTIIVIGVMLYEVLHSNIYHAN